MKRTKTINSGKWIYTLKAGKSLRSAIDDEDYDSVLTELKSCWKEINNNFPEEFDESDLDEVLEDIDNERDNLYNYEDYDMDFEDVEDNINYLLNDLYDFCDAFNIWVEI